MKKQYLAFTILLILAISTKAQVPAEYLASTPCSNGTKPLPGIPDDKPCELMKWRLILIRDSFQLHCTYGLPKQRTTGFTGGGTVIDLHGKWSIAHGTATDRAAIVYRLTDGKTHESISFIKLSDEVIHLLDNQMHLMIGTAAWSYTLNKISH